MIKSLGLVLGFTLSFSVWAGDEAAGKQKAATCVACHGPNGISVNPLWPNIGGQKEQYLFKQLMAFHDGQRQDPLMTSVARTLKEQDMRDLAAYFAALKGAP